MTENTVTPQPVVFVLIAVDKEYPNNEKLWGVYATHEQASKQIQIEIEGYGGTDECHLDFSIKEEKVVGSLNPTNQNCWSKKMKLAELFSVFLGGFVGTFLYHGIKFLWVASSVCTASIWTASALTLIISGLVILIIWRLSL